MNPVFNVKCGVAGFYSFAKGKVDANGEPIPGTHVEMPQFKNLVLDQGLDYLYLTVASGGLSTYEMFPACFVGTGNATPAVTDTQLETELAVSSTYMSTSSTFVDHSTDPYWRYVRVYRYAAGVATGNLTEVGVGRDSDQLSSRALILDGGGSPTSITVLADEYLDVTYEWRNYIDPTELSLVATIGGVPYDVTYKPFDIDTVPNIHLPIAGVSGIGQMRVRETDVLGTVYTGPSGTDSSDLSLTISSYTLGNYYADITGEWALDTGNFTTGIGSLTMTSSQARYQFSFDPKIPKDATKILSITVRVSWDRYP
jgi:hypothetical protein